MTYKNMLRGSVALAAIAVLAAPGIANAADNMSTGQSKVKLTIGGQINKALLYADDGKSNRLMVVDNDVSSSRFFLAADAPVSKDVSFGAYMEYEFNSNSSANVSLHGGNGDTGQGNTNFVERYAYVYVKHATLGKLSLGQLSEAADDAMEQDLSGTGDSGVYSFPADLGGSILFRNASTGATGPAVNTVFSNFDGGRGDGIRYESPTFMGFTGLVSYQSGGGAGASLRYANKFGPVDMVAGLGYSNYSGLNATVEDQLGGSVSFLHSSGLNLTGAMGRNNVKPGSGLSNAESWYIKAGYIAKIFGAGTTNFGIDFGKTKDLAATGDNAKTYGVGVVQYFESIGASAYGQVRAYQLDRVGTANFDDVIVVSTGLKVAF